MVPKNIGVLRNFVGCSRTATAAGASGPLFFTATDNKIVGPCQFFGNITTYNSEGGDTASTHYVFTNNMMEQLTDWNTPGKTFGFLLTSDNYTPGMNRISLINNVNGMGTTAGVLYSSSVFTLDGSLASWLINGLTFHKMNNYKIS